MADIHFDEINYSEINTFLSVARTLNMSVSAKELNVSQPAVSKRISRLENKYGIILFVRTKTGLQLTPTGKVFYQEMRTAFEHLEKAFTKAADVQASTIHTLNLGYDGFFDIPLLYEIINRFSEKYIHIKTNVYHYSAESCSDLFNGKADLMICPDSYITPVSSYVKSEPISAFQFFILVSRNHPLSEKKDLGIQDLKGVPLTVAHINSDSPYVLALKEMFIKYGFSPRIEHLVTRNTFCFEIITHNGIGIATPVFWKRFSKRAVDFFENHIKAYPIEGENYPVSFVWRAENADVNIPCFIELFKTVRDEGNNIDYILKSYN